MEFKLLDCFTDKNNYINKFSIGPNDKALMIKLLERDVALNKSGYKKHKDKWIPSHPHSKFIRLFTGVTPETRNFAKTIYTSSNPVKMFKEVLENQGEKHLFIPEGFVDAIRASHLSYHKSDTVLLGKTKVNYTIDEYVYFAKIKAPLFLWKQVDTYHRGLISMSESTMHSLHKTSITQENFSLSIPSEILTWLNKLLDGFKENSDIRIWRQLINDLPCGYMQTRCLMLERSNVARMMYQREKHRLVEWRWLVGELKEMFRLY